MTDLTVGAIVHGFCGGYFGRDSYACRRVEAVGPDWIVTRNGRGGVELGTDLPGIAEHADDRGYCGVDCVGPDWAGTDD